MAAMKMAVFIALCLFQATTQIFEGGRRSAANPSISKAPCTDRNTVYNRRYCESIQDCL